MINKLVLNNFKCFVKQEFVFANMTILCGSNSVGKSTIIQSLLMLRQTYNKDKFLKRRLDLAGEYFSFGHAADVISHNASDNIISFGFDDIDFIVDYKMLNMEDYFLNLVEGAPPEVTHDFFYNDFIYLSAERFGPRNSYDVNYDSSIVNVGIYGEYAISEFVRLASEAAVNQNLALKYSHRFDDGAIADSEIKKVKLEIAVKEAMREICPGFDISYNSFKNLDKVSSAYRTQGVSTAVRPVNTGFGVSCILPIVIAAFCIRENGTLIIENPEVHLHPEAQSKLAQFLAAVSETGVQVIIETHSDHIVNGARVFVKEKSKNANQVVINSISSKDSVRVVKTIKIDSDGNLSDVDEGFFDQMEKDLLRLF